MSERCKVCNPFPVFQPAYRLLRKGPGLNRSFSASVSLVLTLLAVFGVRGDAARSQAAASGVAASAVATNRADALSIRFKAGQTRFRQGEIIQVELGDDPTREVGSPLRAAPDHHPGLAVDRFRLEPSAGTADPLRDFLASVSAWAGPPPRDTPFVERHGPWSIAVLNEWFRFDKPGQYHLNVEAHAVGTRFEAYRNPEPGTPIIKSNTVEFEIVPADPAWQRAQIETAQRLLGTRFNYSEQQRGCRILRFLIARDAVDQMIEHYGDDQSVCTGEYRDGLFAFPDREYVVKRMEDGVLGPGQAVSASYLDTLATLSAYVERPEFLPAPDDPNLGTNNFWGGGSLGAHWEVIQAEEERFARELVEALPSKVGEARALCLKGLFDSPLLGQPTLLKGADEGLLKQLRGELAAAFTELPPSEQMLLLQVRWPGIASPELLPVLESLYRNPSEGASSQFMAILLDRIRQLSPAEGRALIIEEMKRPHPRLDLNFVSLLPDKELPELDEPLAENLEASNGQDNTIVELIGRYATSAIFQRVQALEEDRIGQMPCEAQAGLIAYAFKSDPASGAEMLLKALASRERTRCYVMMLGEVARRRMTPELEQIAIAHLDDTNPEVAASGAATLGRYGSPAAEQALWDRLEKWRGAWAGRASVLPQGSGPALPNGDQVDLELSLVNAIATGQTWFAGREKLRRLAGLCVSQPACQSVRGMLEGYSENPLVAVNQFGEGPYSSTVSQYQPDSIEALEQKLAQFPEGTAFGWEFNGDVQQGQSVLKRVRSFLKQYGITIQ